VEDIVYTIPEVERASKTGRTKLYEEIAAGRLKVTKVGRKTLVTSDQLRDWLRRCEQATPPAPLARALKTAAAAWAPPAPKTAPLHDAHVREFERVKGKRTKRATK
jgi:excisionase family DNA binding protein